jgi:hypothetical protein
VSDTNEFVTDDTDSQDPGKLRQLLKQAHATLKQKDQELESLRSQEAERSAQAAWDELKVPDAIRDFYKGEQTPEAMKAWWEDSKSFFNIEQAEQDKTVQQTPEQQAQRAAAEQYQQAAGLGTDSLATGVEAAFAKAQATKTLGRGAEFDAARKALYEAQGVPEY